MLIESFLLLCGVFQVLISESQAQEVCPIDQINGNDDEFCRLANDFVCNQEKNFESGKWGDDCPVACNMANPDCQAPWICVNLQCILVVHNEEKTWEEAQTFCKNHAGLKADEKADLLVPVNKDMLGVYMEKKKEYPREHYWVGGKERHWTWVNDVHDENCLYTNSKANAVKPYIESKNCRRKSRFICEKKKKT